MGKVVKMKNRHPNQDKGKPAHRVTKKNQKLVYEMHADAKTQLQIANELKISVATLTKYYRAELDSAQDELRQEFTNTLYDCARQAKDDPKYMGALTFLMARQFGFIEKKEIDNRSTDGTMSPGDKKTTVVVPFDEETEDGQERDVG